MTLESRTWASKLGVETVEDQVRALQEISRLSEITGCTIEAVKLSGSADENVRIWAAASLESAIQPTLADSDGLAELLYGEHRSGQPSGNDGEVCYWAATMLGRLGSRLGDQAGIAVRALETCLSDSLHLPARERAAWALAQFGPMAASAATTLRRTAEDAPPRLQRLINKVLRNIGEAA